MGPAIGFCSGLWGQILQFLPTPSSARSPHRILGGPRCTARDSWPRGEEALRRGVQRRTRRCPSFLHTRPSLHGSLLGVTHRRPPRPHLAGRGKSDSSAGPGASRQTHCRVQEVHTDWAALSAPTFSPFSFSLLPWRRKAGLHNRQLSLCSRSVWRKEWNWLGEDGALTGLGSQGELQALWVGSRGPGRVGHEGQPW